jgi:hypothetical protein
MCWAGISSRNDSVTRHVLGFLFILLFMYLFLPRREITFGPPSPGPLLLLAAICQAKGAAATVPERCRATAAASQ